MLAGVDGGETIADKFTISPPLALIAGNDFVPNHSAKACIAFLYFVLPKYLKS